VPVPSVVGSRRYPPPNRSGPRSHGPVRKTWSPERGHDVGPCGLPGGVEPLHLRLIPPGTEYRHEVLIASGSPAWRSSAKSMSKQAFGIAVTPSRKISEVMDRHLGRDLREHLLHPRPAVPARSPSWYGAVQQVADAVTFLGEIREIDTVSRARLVSPSRSATRWRDLPSHRTGAHSYSGENGLRTVLLAEQRVSLSVAMSRCYDRRVAASRPFKTAAGHCR